MVSIISEDGVLKNFVLAIFNIKINQLIIYVGHIIRNQYR